jgi:serine phosphatase RsbU (regulator of sigma subunit)/anti-sigma regulatory factor (Ser/Thr protein kinase)
MKCELSCCLEVQEPDLSHVTEAVTQLTGFLRDHGVTDTVFLGEFELAAAEAINNAVEHGCSESGERYFHSWLYLRPDHIELRVLDPSDFEGWESPPSLPDDPFDEGGRGHYLMAQMSDEILHEKDAGRHVLVLRKRFADGKWDYIPGHADRVLSEMTDELVASYEMISTLLGLGEWLASAPDLDAFTRGALERLCEVTGAQTAYVRLVKKSSLVLKMLSGEVKTPPPESIAVDGTGAEAEVFRSGKEITLPLGSALAPDDPLAPTLDSGFVAPVEFKDRREGVLVVAKDAPSAYFDAGQLKIARTVADYLGITAALRDLQKRRSLEDRALRDLEIAAQIQASLTPFQFDHTAGLDVFGTCSPAQRAGGDYFDFLVLPDGGVCCMVADVMGKGLPAALIAMMLRTTMRAILAAGCRNPGEALNKANTLLCEDLLRIEVFVTLACAHISPDRTTLDHASAGHLASIIQRRSGECEEMTEAGLPIGINAGTRYDTERKSLGPGDRILLFTDGIAESQAPDGTFFGIEGVKAFLARTSRMASREAVGELIAEVAGFSGKSQPLDDRTVFLATCNL